MLPDTVPKTAALNAAIAVTAAVSYGFGFALDSGSAAAWAVRLAVLAGLAAGFALLQRQSHAVVIAVLAAAGFLDALTVAVAGDDGLVWGVVAANGVQAVCAVVAALLTRDATPVAQNDQYSAYVDYYNEATRRYYEQQAAYAAESDRQAAYAQASARATAAPTQQRRAEQQHAGYSEFAPTASTAEPRHSRSAATQPATPPLGLPTSEHLATAAPPWHTAERRHNASGD